MKLSQGYRKAARIVDKGRFAACGAIFACAGREANHAGCWFRDLFVPSTGDVYWWGYPSICSKQDHNARVLALLFMAEIAKDTERESALSAD